jgi:hypothetical protein
MARKARAAAEAKPLRTFTGIAFVTRAIPNAKLLRTLAGIAFCVSQFRTQNRCALLLESL